ncbi:MAG: ion transporter [Planctomycetales bacterium]|nr:ion transporter [Planctomycetales bacterium]
MQMAQASLKQTFELTVQALILYSMVTMALETMPELARWHRFFVISEIAVVIVFTLEYLYRWSRANRKLSYPFTPMAVVDLLAVLPFYLSLGLDLRGLRAIRLLRIFRILKLGRHSEAMRVLAEAFRRTGSELLVFGFIAAIVIYISAIALYYAEHEAQPAIYPSIPAALWWAIVTLTTVGYGDAYPTSPAGKVVASIIMLTGIGMVAVPTGLLSSAMTEIMRERRALQIADNKSSIHPESIRASTADTQA